MALKSAWLLIVPTALLIGWAAWAYKSGALLAYLPKHVGGGAEFPVLALCLGLLALIGLFFHFAPMLVNGVLAELPLNNLGGLMLVPFILLFWFMFGIAFVTVLYDHCVKPPLQE